MMETAPLDDRARELTRLWAAERAAIVAALPDHIVALSTPQLWLNAAWTRMTDPALARPDPAALVAAVRTMAADGVLPHEGRLYAQGCGVTFVPSWRAMRCLLMRSLPGLQVRADVVADGDEFIVIRSHGGSSGIQYLNHQRRPECRVGEWHHVFASAIHPALPARKATVLLTRAEAMDQAGRHLVPLDEDDESTAMRVVLIRLAQTLPIERDWAPARRFFGVVARIWSEARA